MAQEQRVVTSPSQILRCTPHTTYYSNLFVLKTAVAINEQQAEIAFSEDGELTLNCRYPSTKCLTLNYHTISAELEGIFRKHGVNRVNNSWCESALYFQVSFHSQESVWNFLRSHKEMEIELSTFLSRHLPVSKKASSLICEVDTELFLIIVDAQKKDAWVEAVSESNYSTCLALWKESAVFEFGSLFRAHQSRPKRNLVNYPLTLVQLVTELADVVEWFNLGFYLGVPEPELLKIEADDRGPNQGRTERCKMALFSWWLKNGEQSWSAVVKALVKINMTELAQKVAPKYGISMLETSELEQPSVAELPATIQDQGKEAELITAASSLNTEMRKKVSLGKKRAQETQRLAESSSKIRRLTIERDKGRRELERKEQELSLYTRLQQELATQKDIEHLKVKIARKEEKIKHLKAQLDRVEKELNQAREECKQRREQIQQTTVELAVQCEKTRNLERTVAELKRERKEKNQQLILSVAKNQVHLSQLHANMDKEVDSLKQEIKEKNSMIRALSSQLEVKKTEEKELEEGQLAQMAAEISDLMARLEEAEDGKMRAEEELKDLQYEDNTQYRPWSTMQQVVATPRDKHQVSYQHEDVPTEDIVSDDSIYHIDITRSDGGFWSRRRSQGGGFGFSITGGAEYNAPLRVLKIAKGGAAGKDGKLRVNDELLEINGHLTEGMLYSNAMTIFKGSGEVVRLVVRRVPEQTSSAARGNTLQQNVDPADFFPTYCDPNEIRREEALGTHDLYAVPVKKPRENTLQQNLADPIYADPNELRVRHEEAGTYDLYTVPEKKPKKKPAPEETDYLYSEWHIA